MKKIDPSSLIQLLPDQLPLIEPRLEIPNLNYVIFGDGSDNNILGTIYDDVIFSYGGDDTLIGLEGNDSLYGGSNNDFLYGNGGADSLIGGDGDDNFFVEETTDSVYESVNEGYDRIFSSVNFDLANAVNVESLMASSSLNISLFGNALDNFIIGNKGNNTLLGRDGNDSLSGLDGDDILDGGTGDDILFGDAGLDQMTGGSGSDEFYVDSGGDRVFETTSANPDDFDFVTIQAPMSFFSVEGQDIERIDISFGLGNVAVRGSNTSQLLWGNEGDNVITGLGGDDELLGEDGNDTLNGGEGNDTLSGSNGSDTIYGEGGDDHFFIGNFFPDSTADRDILWSGSGHDIFEFLENNAVPTIKDFSVLDDVIHIYSGSFPGLALGDLDENAFFRGARAETSEHRIIYNRDLGRVYYDQDGAGGVDQVLLVNLSTRPKDLSAADFVIV